MLRFEIDGAQPLGSRPHRGGELPWPGGILGAEFEFEGAGTRAGQAQMDVLEPGLLAVAAIVDHQIAALQPDLGQIAAVEAERAEAVEPGEKGGEILLQASACASRAAGACRRQPPAAALRRTASAGVVASGALFGAGRHRDPAVGFDADRKFGADEVKPLGARMAAEQAALENPTSALGALAITVPS